MAETWDYIDDDCTDLEGTDEVAPTTDPTWVRNLVSGPPNEYINDSGDTPAAPVGKFKFHSDSEDATADINTDVGSLTDDVTMEIDIEVTANSHVVGVKRGLQRTLIYTGKHLPDIRLVPKASGDVFDVYQINSAVALVDTGLDVTLPIGERHLIRYVVDGSGATPTIDMYLDGIFVGQITNGRVSVAADGTIQLMISSETSGTNEFLLDSIKVTNGQQPPPAKTLLLVGP